MIDHFSRDATSPLYVHFYIIYVQLKNASLLFVHTHSLPLSLGMYSGFALSGAIINQFFLTKFCEVFWAMSGSAEKKETWSEKHPLKFATFQISVIEQNHSCYESITYAYRNRFSALIKQDASASP